MTEIGVIDAIARVLVADLPAGWREVTAVYRATTSYAELDADLVGPAGEPAQVDPLPDGLEDHFETLRRQMYRPDTGTWFTATVMVTANGHFSTDFDYDDEPAWSMPVDRSIYPADLAEFPRAAQHVPGWLR